MKVSQAAIVDDSTDHYAYYNEAGWHMSWLPGRELTLDQAIIAMQLTAYEERWRESSAMELTLREWAKKLGLTLEGARALIYAASQ